MHVLRTKYKVPQVGAMTIYSVRVLTSAVAHPPPAPFYFHSPPPYSFVSSHWQISNDFEELRIVCLTTLST